MDFTVGRDGDFVFASGANAAQSTILFQRDFRPLDFPYLSSWFSVDSGVYTNETTVANPGNPISKWLSRVNGTDLRMDTTAKQPQFINGGVYFSSIASSANNDILSGVTSEIYNAPLNYYLAVNSITGYSTNSSAYFVKLNTASASNSYAAQTLFGNMSAANITIANSNIQLSNTRTSVLGYIFDTTNTATVRNGYVGENLAGLGGATNTAKNIVVGGQYPAGNAFYINGTIYEILIYTGVAHTSGQQNRVLKYLADKWGASM